MMMEHWKRSTAAESVRKTYQQQLQETDQDLAALLEIHVEQGYKLAHQTDGELAGLPFAVKDNIAVEGFSYTCASKILEGLKSPYTATAVERLLQAGAIPVAKANLDEFGMGSSTENSAYRSTVNPWNRERVPGGSSGGSAAAAAAGMVPFALGSDTGGSVRQPAAFCGIYGLKPTYGSVSRYGLAAYASSLETIGVLSPDLELTRNVYDCIRGGDFRDQTSMDIPEDPKKIPRPAEKTDGCYTVGVLKGELGLDPAVQQNYERTKAAVQSLGWQLKEIEIPMLEYAMPAYYTIAMAEASANLARYTGIRYGFRDTRAQDPAELVRMTRTEGFGQEVKLRILIGTYVLRSGFQDRYYIRAQKIRSLLQQELAEHFKYCQLIMMPVFPTQAFPLGDSGLTPIQQKVADRFTLTANLAAVPALSIPTGIDEGLPSAVQFMAPAFGENRLFDAAARISEMLPPPEIPGQFSFEKLMQEAADV